MHLTRSSLAGALSVICAIAAHAQTAKTVPVDTINVSFGGTCREPKGLQLVMGDDQKASNVMAQEKGLAVWKLDRAIEIDPKHFFVSVRFEGGRSDCQPPHSVAGRVASFQFYACNLKPIHTVGFATVTKGTREPIHVRYSRDSPLTADDSVACNTGAVVRSNFEHRVDALWTEIETFKLQMAYDKDPDIPTPLIVLSPNDHPKPLLTMTKAGVLVFSRDFQQGANKVGVLSRPGVLRQIDTQCGESGQRCGENARQKSDAILKAVGFEGLALTVN